MSIYLIMLYLIAIVFNAYNISYKMEEYHGIDLIDIFNTICIFLGMLYFI